MRQQLDTSQPWEMTQVQQERLQRDITPGGQIERAAQVVHVQRIQQAQVDALITLIQSSEGERIFQQERERKQRKPVYTSGLVTRQQPALAAMQAELRRDNARLEVLRQRASRERSGYR